MKSTVNRTRHSKVRMGIISFAHMHAHSYAKQLMASPVAELVAVWDSDETRAIAAAGQYGAVMHHTLDGLLSDKIDAVIICSENSCHYEHVIAAAKAGKHILCEKPIATQSEAAADMIRICDANQVKLQIAFPVRYSPAIQELQRAIEANLLGRILAVNSTNHGQMPGGWFVEKSLSGGGAAMDHIVHIMDILRWTLQDEAEDVYAELGTRFHDIQVEDCGIVLIRMSSGAIVSIDPSWSRPTTFPTWGDFTLEIVGTKGTLSLDLFRQSTMFYHDSEERIEQLFWGDDMDNGLVADFIRAVRDNEPVSITGQDALRVLEVVEAAYHSADSGLFEPVRKKGS